MSFKSQICFFSLLLSLTFSTKSHSNGLDTGNQGNGVGNNCTGNQGNTDPVGCAAGGTNGSSNNGDNGNENGDNGNQNGDNGNQNGDNGNQNGDNGNQNGDNGNQNGDNGNQNGDNGNQNGDNGNQNGDNGNQNGDNGNQNGDNGNQNGDNGNQNGDNGNQNGENGEENGGENGDDEGDDDGDDDDKKRKKSKKDHDDSQSKNKFRLLPLIIIELDKLRSIENLSPEQITSGEFSRGLNATLDHYRHGFKEQRFVSYSVGLGVVGNWYYENPQSIQEKLSWFAGLAPIKSKDVLFTRYLNNERELEKKFDRKIPFNATQLKSWKIGESVRFDTQGGILFLAGVSPVPYTALGLTYVASGKHKTYIEKLDHQKVLVSIQRSELDTISGFAGSAVVNVSKTLAQEEGIGFTYIFDLSDLEAQKKYQDFLKGNIIPSQESDLRGDLSVEKVNESIFSVSTRTRNLTWTVPFSFSYIKSSKGKTYGFNKIYNYDDQTKVQTDYSIYTKSHQSKLVVLHENISTLFTATVAKVIRKNLPEEKIINGNFSWKFQHDHPEGDDVNQAIQDLIDKTNLKKELSYNVQDQEDLDYAQVHFDLEISENLLKFLVKRSTSDDYFDALKSLLKKKVLDSKYNDSQKIQNCHDDNFNLIGCQKRIVGNVHEKLDEIRKILISLKESNGENSKQMAQLISEFGKKVWENKYVFEKIHELTKYCGGKLNFTVSGRRMSYYQTIQTYEHDRGKCWY